MSGRQHTVLIIIIIVVKYIYKVQDRLRGHKCAMTTERYDSLTVVIK